MSGSVAANEGLVGGEQRPDNKVVVLAYSGGLDTSCILVWLLEQGYEVVAFMANLGQEEDFDAAAAKAKSLGAQHVVVEDMRARLVRDFVWPAVQAELCYEGRYLLGTALARPCIVQGLVAAVRRYGAGSIAHGATGKGNDQVRFEFGCAALLPDVKVIAPWRLPEFMERFQGRQDLFEYAKLKNIPLPVTQKNPWSIDGNIVHVSYESGVLEDPAVEAPRDLCQITCRPEDAPDEAQVITINFRGGVPSSVTVDGEEVEDGERSAATPLEILSKVNKLAAAHGVGRVDIVENRFLGLKSRGVYETPGLTVLRMAHEDLEIVCMDRELRKIKQTLSRAMADQVYNGFWFSPECEFTRECIASSQRYVNGWVRLKLYKGAVYVLARAGSVGSSLYNARLVSMDEGGGFRSTDATGFIALHGLRLRQHGAARAKCGAGDDKTQ